MPKQLPCWVRKNSPAAQYDNPAQIMYRIGNTKFLPPAQELVVSRMVFDPLKLYVLYLFVTVRVMFVPFGISE
jgi:hypothetical protein